MVEWKVEGDDWVGNHKTILYADDSLIITKDLGVS